MAWNDGISELINEELTKLEGLGDIAISASRSVIDEEADRFQKNIVSDTPTRTGGLARSFTVQKKDIGGWYGYTAEFEGNAPNGTPYQKIANILNYGKSPTEKSGAISGTFFITRAIRKLKGMDDRIEARIAAEIAKRT